MSFPKQDSAWLGDYVCTLYCSPASFEPVTQPFNFPKEEEKVIAYWREIDAFQTSLKLSEGKPEYVFFDGPPFATGLPHYGHLLAGTIKVCNHSTI
jgi:isoleucyl-tRNA synthetase